MGESLPLIATTAVAPFSITPSSGNTPQRPNFLEEYRGHCIPSKSRVLTDAICTEPQLYINTFYSVYD